MDFTAPQQSHKWEFPGMSQRHSGFPPALLLLPAVQVMRHGVGLSTGSDSELITQLLALTPPMEEQDTPDWVARSASELAFP